MFVIDAFHMITNCDKNIASWDSDGKSFTVYDKDRLGSEEIPKYFKHNQYSSFMRSLNSYRFKKVGVDAAHLPEKRNDPNFGVCHQYSHPGFVRGRIDLLESIHNNIQKPKKSTVEHIGNAAQEIASLEDENKILKYTNANLQSEIARLQAELASLKASGVHESKQLRGGGILKRRFNTIGGDNIGDFKRAISSYPSNGYIRIRSGIGEFEEIEEPMEKNEEAEVASYPTEQHDLRSTSIMKTRFSNLPKKNLRKPVRLQKRQSSRLVFQEPTVEYFQCETKEGLVAEKPGALFFRSVSEDKRFLEIMLGDSDDLDELFKNEEPA